MLLKNDLKVRLDDETNENLMRLAKDSKKGKSDVVRDLINTSKVEYISNGKEIVQRICQVHADINAIAHGLEQQFVMLKNVIDENIELIQFIRRGPINESTEQALNILAIQLKKEEIVLQKLVQQWDIEKNNAERRIDEYVDFSCNYESR